MTDPVTKPADTPVMEAARRIVAAYEEHRKTFPYEPRLDPGAEGREKAARRDLESANNAAGPLVARALIRMHAALKDALLQQTADCYGPQRSRTRVLRLSRMGLRAMRRHSPSRPLR